MFGVLNLYSYTALTTQCGGELAGLRGALVSPNYPSHYPPRASCVWAIHVPGAGNAIALRFTDFQLEPPVGFSNACLYDALEVRTNTLLLVLLGAVRISDPHTRSNERRLSQYSRRLPILRVITRQIGNPREF